MAKWIKTTPFGNYLDPVQNHKFDSQLILNPSTKEIQVYDRRANLYHEAQWYFGKHIGSKKLSNIKALTKRFSGASKRVKQITKAASNTSKDN